MKQRVISGVLIAAITVLVAWFGGILLDAVLLFIGLYGSYEFIHIRKERFNLPLYIIQAITILLLFFFHDYSLSVTLLELVVLLGLAVFDENETFDDVSSVFLMSTLLGHAIYFMRYIQHTDKWMFAYVLIISYITDVFAYFVGRAFGKHKLNERVSPKKTIEGAIGGWLFGCIASLAWAALFHFFGIDSRVIILASVFLPLVSQIGDLSFSLVKRHYGVKDFSNLIPGHGGILDRMDSHIFCIILFGALINLFI